MGKKIFSAVAFWTKLVIIFLNIVLSQCTWAVCLKKNVNRHAAAG
jgi:hypothetical protein